MPPIGLLDGGLDFREGARDFGSGGHCHAELPRDLRDGEDAAHHRALGRPVEQPFRRDRVEVDHQRVLTTRTAQRLEHMPDTRALDVRVGDDFDLLGGRHHVGGGSHGSLHSSDSLGALVLCGLGVAEPDVEQWSIRDVAPLVLGHFGLERNGGRRSAHRSRT